MRGWNPNEGQITYPGANQEIEVKSSYQHLGDWRLQNLLRRATFALSTAESDGNSRPVWRALSRKSNCANTLVKTSAGFIALLTWSAAITPSSRRSESREMRTAHALE